MTPVCKQNRELAESLTNDALDDDSTSISLYILLGPLIIWCANRQCSTQLHSSPSGLGTGCTYSRPSRGPVQLKVQ